MAKKRKYRCWDKKSDTLLDEFFRFPNSESFSKWLLSHQCSPRSYDRGCNRCIAHSDAAHSEELPLLPFDCLFVKAIAGYFPKRWRLIVDYTGRMKIVMESTHGKGRLISIKKTLPGTLKRSDLGEMLRELIIVNARISALEDDAGTKE